MSPCAYSTFNGYFVRKRVLWMSVSQSLVGVGTMFYPFMVRFLLDEFGFRGAMATIAAVNGHAILGMLIMYPAHKMNKVPVKEPKQCKFIILW